MIRRKPIDIEFTLKGATHAALILEGKFSTHFEVTELDYGLFRLWCTHGSWPCQVTADGKSFNDPHFEDGRQMVNTIERVKQTHDDLTDNS